MLRMNLWLWVLKICGVTEGNVIPRYLLAVRFLLFPQTLWQMVRQSGPISYDLQTGVFTIYGMRYSEQLFYHWSNYGLPVGEAFRIVKREDGLITLARLWPLTIRQKEYLWKQITPAFADMAIYGVDVSKDAFLQQLCDILENINRGKSG